MSENEPEIEPGVEERAESDFEAATPLKYTAFIPQGENRRETARYLIDLCHENDLDVHNVQSGNGGFNVTDAIADLIGDTTDPDGEKNSLANLDADPDEMGQEPAVSPETSEEATKAPEPVLDDQPDPLPNGGEEQVDDGGQTAPAKKATSKRGGKSATK